MNKYILRIITIGIAVILLSTACAPKATPTPVDMMGTAAQLAAVMQTQTSSAYTPTPPPPTITPTPSFTDTPVATPTKGPAPQRPVVLEFTGCWRGPGDKYTLISNISPKKRLDVIGRGTEPGWIIVRNPYFHNPCWIEIAHLRVDPNMDFSIYPVMTPGP
jgi:hypothetical protein